MPSRIIRTIVIHCSATADGVALARTASPGRNAITAAQVINGWHASNHPPFERDESWRARFNPHLSAIGYHYVIDVDGTIESGRHRDERGAHVKDHNLNSIGICCVGTARFRLAQWHALKSTVESLLQAYPYARVMGHRDYSPDRNRDGVITRDEWVKTCPGFEVHAWWRSGFAPVPGHIVEFA